MSISPQTIAPLSQQLVDPNTGFPTKPLADFLFHLANTAGYDDEALKTEIESILGTQAEHGGLITKLLDSLQDEANARKVALQVLQQQIVDDTLALTRKIDFYKSRLNDINASFTRIQQSQVSDREASAKMKQTFSAENKSRKAEIKTEMLARIDADSAIASDITQLQTDLGSVDGAVSGNSSAISALDARVTTNEGDISANASDITSLQSDLTDIGGDVSGNSSAISTLQTNVSQNISDIGSVQANASQALADASSAQSTADAATSAAQLAQDTADGKITAFYQATAPSGGVESGDLWFDTNDGNKCHRWTGSSWSAIDDARIADAVSAAATAQSTADGKVVTFVQSSQPVAEGTGDLWFDSNDSYKAYRWNGSSWASMVDRRVSTALSDASQALADASSAQSTADAATSAAQLAQDTADGKITAFYQATAPSGGVESGDLWFDTNDGNKCHRWTGSSWSAIDDARIADAVSAAATAQSTADGKVVTFVQNNPPTADAVGDLWFDSDDEYKMHRWSGSAWVEVADARISVNASDITSLQSDLTNIGGDVSGNSSAISTLQTNVSDLDGVVDAMASDVTSLEASIAAETSNRQNADDTLSASITSEQTARVSADNDLAVDVAAVASDLTTLSSTVGSHTTSITTLSQSIDGIEGKWGVAIDSNGNITGIELIGGGDSGLFKIDADVLVNGTLTADKIVSGAVVTDKIAEDAVSSYGYNERIGWFWNSNNPSNSWVFIEDVIIYCENGWLLDFYIDCKSDHAGIELKVVLEGSGNVKTGILDRGVVVGGSDDGDVVREHRALGSFTVTSNWGSGNKRFMLYAKHICACDDGDNSIYKFGDAIMRIIVLKR